MSTNESNGSNNNNDSANADAKPAAKGKNNRRFRKYNTHVQQQAKFDGKCADLKGHIYDYSNARQADMYAKTTKEIAEYVNKEYTCGGDIRRAVERLERPIIPEPADPPDNATYAQQKRFEAALRSYTNRIDTLESNIENLYGLVIGQCTDIMRQKIKESDDFPGVEAAGDGIELLKIIRDVSNNFESHKFLPYAIYEAKRKLYNCKQGNLSAQEYLEKFQVAVAVVEHVGGLIGEDPGVLQFFADKLGIAVADMNAEQRTMASDVILAMMFIGGVDPNRYKSKVEHLEEAYLEGQNNYPGTLAEAYKYLSNWKPDSKYVARAEGNDAVAFVNSAADTDDVTLATQGRSAPKDLSHITCHTCGKQGHYSPQCPDKKGKSAASQQSGDQMLTAGIDQGEFLNDRFQFVQLEGTNLNTSSQVRRIPSSWILLDNQSTIDVFHNGALLSNIRPASTEMIIHTTAGNAATNMIGDLAGYGTVWYHPSGIANILSLSRVLSDSRFHVTFDSRTSNEFHVIRDNGTTRVFKQSPRGLYFMDTAKEDGTVLITTVDGNRSKFSQRDYTQAELARSIQSRIGYPSTQAFLKIVDDNLLPNIPVSRRDIQNAELIFGPNVDALRGKTVRQSPLPVTVHLNDLPSELMEVYRDVTLCGDVMFVNGIPFFVSTSRHIHFSTTQYLENQQMATILSSIKAIQATYLKRGFRITHLLLDGAFEPLRGDLAALHITLNTVSNDEHVPEIERFIRTLKERTRCIYNSLPFQRFPPRILIEMVYASTFWLNSFPHPLGISQRLSPRAIVAGATIDYNQHCQLEFGSYVQTHEEHDNSMASRTTGALALRPSGNLQGGYLFYSLTSGRVITRNRWTVLPLPQDTIDRIHVLARRANAARGGLDFVNRRGRPYTYNDADADDAEDAEDADDDDSSFHPDPNHVDVDIDNDAADDDDDVPAFADLNDPVHFDLVAAPDVDLAGVDVNENNDNAHNIEIAGVDENVNDIEIAGLDENENDNVDMEQEVDMAVNDRLDNINPEPEQEVNNEVNNDIQQNDNIAQIMDEQYGPRSDAYNLRPRKPRDYSHLHAVLEETVLTQHSLKTGIKLFGSAGTDAVLKELQQLHDRKVLEPIKSTTLNTNEKKKALSYLMFLKQKRCGKIKGRGCADGRKQREYLNKDETSSPTVSIESIMLTSTIDAQEGRDVATVDIPGAFMQADMDDTVHMRFEGTMAKLLIELDPDYYTPFVTEEKGKPVVYLLMRKALYGTLKAAKLFWQKLSGVLESWGFVINPYDCCVANKTINGSQCTIIWHVDDLKISHCNSSVVDEVIQMLSAEFGKEAPLSIHRGRVHEYLGMTLDFSIPGKVKIGMEDYVKNMLQALPDNMDGTAVTPAAGHLFEVNHDNPELLDQETADMFHHNVAKLLFLCKRARPDIQTAVSFLCTRVKCPDIDDYKKLRRVMQYLRHTIDLSLTLEADNTKIMKWWIDASFGVHPDMRSHTGGVLTLGKGAAYATSTKQKLMTKSSTEAELVGVNDVLSQVLWTRHFLDAQGYDVIDSTIYQDNQSAILLENNGRASSSKRTRHINIRFFFVHEKVHNHEVTIKYCPTKEMVADFFTKPLQGSTFQRLRDMIMNVDHACDSNQDHRSVLENEDDVSGDATSEWKVVTRGRKKKKYLDGGIAG